MLIERMDCTVEEWDERGGEIRETLCRASNPLIARAAFFAALELRPGARLTCRKRAHVICDSDRPKPYWPVQPRP